MDEFLLLSYREHLTLEKYKDLLESQHNVKINMPVINSNEKGTDVTFTSVSGNVKSVSDVKQFLKRKTNDPQDNDASVVVLSSDDEDENIESNIMSKCNRRRKKAPKFNPNITVDLTDICLRPPLKRTSCSESPEEIFIVDNQFLNSKTNNPQDNDASVVVLSSDDDENIESNIMPKCKRRRKEASKSNPNIIVDLTDICLRPPLNHTSCSPSPEEIFTVDNNQSVIIIEPTTENTAEDVTVLMSTDKNEKHNEISSRGIHHAAEDFVPLTSTNKKKKTKNIASMIESADIIELLPGEEKILQGPRKLRPIVIDGSNIARAHGKPTNTFSSEGIKISVDYFLERGHTEVIAFVPHFRQYCTTGTVITTDPDILKEMERKQLVVFTPSKCYDDGFIVRYAAKIGGVILSNDNYRDLMENDNFKDWMDESLDFKETIKNRLLKFCFVRDTLMIPYDPLGSKGPTLQEFLSFPPTHD